MRRAVLIILTALFAAGLSVAPAHAEGSANCGADVACEVVDNGGGGNGGGGNGAGGGGGQPEFPLCPVGGGVVDGAPADWIEITCREGDILTTLWVPPGTARVNPEVFARSLLARVQLRPIKVGITPLAKGANSMGLVGLPVWLWADDPSATTWGPVTITAGNMSLTARVQSVTWVMGDGAKVSCGKGTEWKRGMVKADGSAYPSPTCGHTYSEQGTYSITVTSHWNAHWSGYGQSGDIPVSLSTSFRYVVAELQAIRVR